MDQGSINKGSCYKREEVKFGFDTVSTCDLEIPEIYNESSRCKNMRMFISPVLIRWESMAIFYFKSIPTSLQEWLPLMVETLKMQCRILSIENAWNSLIPLDLNFVETRTHNLSVASIVPLHKRILVNTSSSNFSSTCEELTDRVRIEILYTRVLRFNSKPLNRIVGARKTAESSNTFLITGPKILRLTLVIVFVEVPVKEPQVYSRFWEEVLTPDESSVAWRYIFRNLFWDPSSTSFSGDDVLDRSFLVMLLISVAFIYLVLIVI